LKDFDLISRLISNAKEYFPNCILAIPEIYELATHEMARGGGGETAGSP
jgi:hypothetical protein